MGEEKTREKKMQKLEEKADCWKMNGQWVLIMVCEIVSEIQEDIAGKPKLDTVSKETFSE